MTDPSSRRRLLKTATVFAAAASLGGFPRFASGAAPAPRATARRVIFLFMSGGPAQLDTFDVKRTPDTSLTKAIPTSADGVEVSDLFPRFARLAHRAGIVRSLITPIPDHALGRYYTHTGYRATPGIVHPGIGSVVAKEMERSDAALPTFVQVGPVFGGVKGDEAVSRYQYYGAGYLGPRYQPLVVKDPERGLADLKPLVEGGAFDARLKLLADLGREFRGARPDGIVDAHEVTVQRSVRLMRSPEAAAFDLSKEPAALRDAYGRTPIGDACLLARRLVEAGVTFVEVGMTGWDTHGEHLARHKVLCGAADPALAALLADLESRGMLDDTLIVWTGEMGRTIPKDAVKAGSNHWGKSGVALLAGGGVRGGQVVGRTDATGQEVVDRPVTVQDLHATIYRSLGIDYHKEYPGPGGRPMPMVDNLTARAAKPLVELFG